jgi:hypothetical protein
LEFYDCLGFIFPEKVLFPKKIDKSISFEEAIFQGSAEFWQVIFEMEAYFQHAIFKSEAHFEVATFEGDANFQIATFQSGAYFFLVTFENAVHFDGATFGDVLIITESLKLKKKIFSEKEVSFTQVKFLKPEKASFTTVDLSKFKFIGTDLRKVEFVDVDWYKEKGRGRNKIYDEVSPESKLPDYPWIAQVYKRLRANYEENLNYAEAGDFHIGEMEMRRKGEKNIFNKGIISLYNLISNYGESYWRPLLFWILPILLLFPILFMYSGIEPVAQSQTPYLINCEFDASSISLTEEKVDDYLKSFVYSLSVFSLVRERQYRPVNNCGHFLMVLESILSPVLIAFFLLALRRRFRR